MQNSEGSRGRTRSTSGFLLLCVSLFQTMTTSSTKDHVRRTPGQSTGDCPVNSITATIRQFLAITWHQFMGNRVLAHSFPLTGLAKDERRTDACAQDLCTAQPCLLSRSSIACPWYLSLRAFDLPDTVVRFCVRIVRSHRVPCAALYGQTPPSSQSWVPTACFPTPDTAPSCTRFMPAVGPFRRSESVF